MSEFQPKQFEEKWQKVWHDKKLYQAEDFSEKKKRYILVEFPYPSGDGLHVGHCLSYTALDVMARHSRMNGYNVLYPMGWDAFGLPAENYAIKHKVHPAEAVRRNIATFKRQIQSLGISFDWSREINTTDPAYYKWTQWIFLRLLKAGLAEKKAVPINWCPSCRIGLAFEEVVDGVCERCGTAVEQRTINQWILKITAYADRLIDDLETVDYLPYIKQQQINWIGRSEGLEIIFRIKDSKSELKIFTTRPDTIYGVTFMVVAPEHPLIHQLESKIQNITEVKRYIEQSGSKTERERQEQKEKTGMILGGVFAINPMTGEDVPIYVADYVMMSYGTGAIMAVPAHDERDWAFARKYSLPIKSVIAPPKVLGERLLEAGVASPATYGHQQGDIQSECWVGNGVMMNSGEFDGLSTEESWEMIAVALEKKVGAKRTIKYKLRDWIFSRQHYWGEPIPVIHCDTCGIVPVPEKDLPVQLPDVDHYEPTDTGESPLAAIKEWVQVKCPSCSGNAQRETDTMPNWAGSSWYFLRYTDPHNDSELAARHKLEYWTPVDLYNGGMEHTTLHLLYSRFWHKFLYDQKIVSTLEPYAHRISHGMILGPDSQKMSKSRGNVINPDTIVETYGADTLRMYEMFMGEYEGTKIWSEESLHGMHRFLKRIWTFYDGITTDGVASASLVSLMHRMIKKIDQDVERRSFNTIVSNLMIFFNEMYSQKVTDRVVLENFLILLAPLAPHIADELWERLGHSESIHMSTWPKYDAALLQEESVTIAVQVNGKVRAEISVTTDSEEGSLRQAVMVLPNVQKYLEGREIKKFIYVKNKIINIVI